MDGTIIRQIMPGDIFNGFLTSLDSLREASSIEPSRAKEILGEINSNPNHRIFVAETGGKIVGSTSLLIEPKFIHNGGRTGHIEDVVVDKKFQGQDIGKELVLAALKYAKDAGCYKTVLYCTDEIRPFYEGLGFKAASNGMRFDH